MPRQFGEQVDVAHDQRRLGDDRHRVPGFQQDLKAGATDPKLALDRLPAIGIDAERDRMRHMAALAQLRAQALGGIGLGTQDGFEVESRRQIQIRVRRPREAIHAAMLAAAIWIDRLREADVRRIVAADDAARALLAYLGHRRGRRIGVIVRVERAPAIVLAMAHVLFETPDHARSCAATLDGRRFRHPHLAFHGWPATSMQVA